MRNIVQYKVNLCYAKFPHHMVDQSYSTISANNINHFEDTFYKNERL